MLPTLPAFDAARPLRLVLDTNVVMALWHFLDPKLQELAAFVCSAQVQLLTRRDCLEELQRVLTYHQFAIPGERQQALHAAYAELAQQVADADEAQMAFSQTLPRCKDRDDQKFISLAWDAGAAVLVTRDKLLLGLARKPPLRERLLILTPERLQQALLTADDRAGRSSFPSPAS